MSALATIMLLTGAGALATAQPRPEPAMPPVPIAVPPPPPPAPGDAVPPQRARANLNSYFSVDDYPAAALRVYHQGTVGFMLVVGVNGRATDCRITFSSGSQALDQATCRILRSRARYTPARDAQGALMEGRDSGRVTWRLPGPPVDRAGLAMAYIPAREEEPRFGGMTAADIPAGIARPGLNEGASALSVAIGRDGRVIGCEVQGTSGAPALDAAACRIFSARARFEPARDMAGAAVCDVTWVRLDWAPAFAAASRSSGGRRAPDARQPRPLREQLNARLCPGWPVTESR